MTQKSLLAAAALAGCVLLSLGTAGCIQPKMRELEADPQTPDAALRARAITVSEQMFADREDPILRANALEGLATGLDAAALVYLRKGAEDTAAVVRGVALMAAGDARLPAGAAMGRKLMEDKNLAVGVSAAYAMACAGDTSAMNLIAIGLAYKKDSRVQAQTTMVMGKLANVLPKQWRASAIEMLRSLTGPEIEVAVRVQAYGAQAALGYEPAINRLRQMLFSRGGDLRMEALVQLGAIPHERKAREALLLMLPDDFPGAQVIAALSLARAGSARRAMAGSLSRAYYCAWFYSQGLGYDYRSDLYFEGGEEITPLSSENVLRTVRIPAIRAVGAIGEPPTSGLLMRLMSDEQPRIRLAAAAAALEYLKLPLRVRKAPPAREM